MAIVWLRNSRDVSEKTISGPGGFGKTAAGNEKPRSFGVQRVVTTLLSFGRFRAICNSVLEQAHFFPIFGVVTTLLSVGRFCKAICNSVLEQTYFLLSLPCNPQQRVVLAGEKIWKILFETVKRISCLRCSLRRMARDMIPTSLRRGLYALICFRVFQSLSPNKQTVVRVRIFTGAAQRSPKSTSP